MDHIGIDIHKKESQLCILVRGLRSVLRSTSTDRTAEFRRIEDQGERGRCGLPWPQSRGRRAEG